MKRCLVCSKLPVVDCKGLELCIDHQNEFLNGENQFIAKYGLEKTMESNGYYKNIFLRKWLKPDFGDVECGECIESIKLGYTMCGECSVPHDLEWWEYK